ncbi:hypothetical protein [Achromobacter marplatensis]|uniref:hypothetical protein n=1 Tax=Achromobacter marplatensis TaxID=470868 RepID=UPI0039F6C859
MWPSNVGSKTQEGFAPRADKRGTRDTGGDVNVSVQPSPPSRVKPAATVSTGNPLHMLSMARPPETPTQSGIISTQSYIQRSSTESRPYDFLRSLTAAMAKGAHAGLEKMVQSPFYEPFRTATISFNDANDTRLLLGFAIACDALTPDNFEKWRFNKDTLMSVDSGDMNVLYYVVNKKSVALADKFMSLAQTVLSERELSAFVTGRAKSGWTNLATAIINGLYGTAGRMIGLGADINNVDGSGRTVLHIAALSVCQDTSEHSRAFLDYVLTLPGLRVSKANSLGETAHDLLNNYPLEQAKVAAVINTQAKVSALLN